MLRSLSTRAVIALVLATAGTGACVPQPTRVSDPPLAFSPEPSIVIPVGWTEHELDGGVHLSLPPDWIALDEDDLTDADRRAEIERDFEGAETLFGQLAAQGRSARIVLLAIDPRARGTGRFPPIFSVVAVEPALPPLLLGIGADFATSALRGAFAIETDVARTDMPTPIGEGIRLGFKHRVVTAPSTAGMLVDHDGVLVTTGSASYLVSRSVETDGAFADAPGLEAVVDTLRVDP